MVQEQTHVAMQEVVVHKMDRHSDDEDFGAASITLNIVAMGGARLGDVKVLPEHNVRDLARVLCQAAGVQSQLLFAFAGDLLPDNMTFGEVGLVDGDVVTAIRCPELFVAVSYENGTVTLSSAETGLQTRTISGTRGAVLSVAFSPKGTLMVTGCMDGTCSLWRVTDGQVERLFEGHRGPVTSVSCSPTQDLMVSASFDKMVRVWNMSTGECLSTLQGHKGTVTCTSFSPDGRYIATGAADCIVHLWKTEGRLAKALHGHHDGICCLAFSPSGQLIATGSQDTIAKIWYVATGVCERKLKGHRGAVRSLTFVPPEGQILVTAGADGAIAMWDVSSGVCSRAFQASHGPLRSVAVSPGGSIMVCGGEDGSVRLWNTATGELKSTLASLLLQGAKGKTQAASVYCVAFAAGPGSPPEDGKQRQVKGRPNMAALQDQQPTGAPQSHRGASPEASTPSLLRPAAAHADGPNKPRLPAVPTTPSTTNGAGLVSLPNAITD